ncbi:MAG TPA: glutathione peroxidase [Candidatus Saccharimonadales bacterium]|nr:glutathione peroxidase [Candidatus Saccharimonadales bacterium]
MTEIQEIPLKTITGEDSSLAAYRGKLILVVNVASKCGLTPQYDGLEKLYERFRDQNFVVLGFPANDFAGQEPGSDAEIQQFCTGNFSVQFPMFSKIAVAGEGRHPLYSALVAARPAARANSDSSFREKLMAYGITPNAEPEVLWNFEKFLIDKDGNVIDRFAPDVTPDDPMLVRAIEKALAA